MTERQLRRIVRTHAPRDHARSVGRSLFAWWNMHHVGNKTHDDLAPEIFNQLKLGSRVPLSMDYASVNEAFEDLIQAARQL